MRKRPLHPRGARDEKRLEGYLDGVGGGVRAPRGFAGRVMNAVYRESLAARPLSVRVSQPMASRLYRRIGLSLALTAAVLAASLLVPHGAYPMLLGGGREAALGAGPSDAVRSALRGAGDAVQGVLGEQQIGGNQK